MPEEGGINLPLQTLALPPLSIERGFLYSKAMVSENNVQDKPKKQRLAGRQRVQE